MKETYFATKRQLLESAWILIQQGRFKASQDLLQGMEPEMKDCEQFHVTWLSSLICDNKWRETELYARRLVERHSDYFLSAWHALINGLCGQNKFAEAKEFLAQASANWPHDKVLELIAAKIAEIESSS